MSRWHPETPQERFWKKVNKNGPTLVPKLGPCWIWTAAINSHGYGQFMPILKPRKLVPAHRFAYETLVGPIPEGLESDHLCRNPACVNPAHLEFVTHKINCRRGTVGIVAGARMRSKTHCPYGHEYTPENTYLNKGRRVCRACRRLTASFGRSVVK